MPGKPKYYLTTPIYYTNGLPHIGHTYSTIVCDTIRRYKRMHGYDVVMTTGTDEHGVNVERCGEKSRHSRVGICRQDGRRVARYCGTNSAFRAMNSFAPRIYATPTPCNGFSSSAAKTVSSIPATTPANTASTTMPMLT